MKAIVLFPAIMTHQYPTRFTAGTKLKMLVGFAVIVIAVVWLATNSQFRNRLPIVGRQGESKSELNNEELDRMLESVSGRKPKQPKRPSTNNSRGAATRLSVKTISRLPRSSEELAEAFNLAAGNACEPIPAGEPLEITNFTPYLTAGDQVSSGGIRPLPSCRRNVLSVGLEVSDADRSTLPALSRGQIIDYLQKHYLAVQVRIQRDTNTSELFLNHRPIAATAAFGRQALTQEFAEAVTAAANDLHSIGLFVPKQTKPTPANLRLLVLVHRCQWSTTQVSAEPGKFQARFEYVFVCARPSEQSPLRTLDLHVFVTDQERQRLHYLPRFEPPAATSDCGIRANVIFTEFSHAKLYPTASAVRASSVQSRLTYAWPRLNEYVKSENWIGEAFDNIPGILDAIIDGKLKPE